MAAAHASESRLPGKSTGAEFWVRLAIFDPFHANLSPASLKMAPRQLQRQGFLAWILSVTLVPLAFAWPGGST